MSARFIPAGAGNTLDISFRGVVIPVYPRWRGEHPATFSCVHIDSGLSPLARGTLLHRLTQLPATRFIPAGAGNTGSLKSADLSTSVYPRWRGEHCGITRWHYADSGLSPLTRGTLRQTLTTATADRFIPAHAGNTLRQILARAVLPVYPRSRGEHILFASAVNALHGLSPLTRGTLLNGL